LLTVELARFRVMPQNEEALLAARPRMLEDFRTDRDGFIDARLVRLQDDEWLDIVLFRSPEDFTAPREPTPPTWITHTSSPQRSDRSSGS
jgi:hypothetical protein